MKTNTKEKIKTFYSHLTKTQSYKYFINDKTFPHINLEMIEKKVNLSTYLSLDKFYFDIHRLWNLYFIYCVKTNDNALLNKIMEMSELTEDLLDNDISFSNNINLPMINNKNNMINQKTNIINNENKRTASKENKRNLNNEYKRTASKENKRIVNNENKKTINNENKKTINNENKKTINNENKKATNDENKKTTNDDKMNNINDNKKINNINNEKRETNYTNDENKKIIIKKHFKIRNKKNDFSNEDRTELTYKVQALNTEQMTNIINVLTDIKPNPETHTFDFDIYSLSNENLHKLEDYVDGCLNINKADKKI